MIAKILIIQILLRINLRNRNLKIVLTDYVKFTLTVLILFEEEKKVSNIQAVLWEL